MRETFIREAGKPRPIILNKDNGMRGKGVLMLMKLAHHRLLPNTT